MSKRIFRKTTAKGTKVTTTYVPRKNQSKKVKNWSYDTKQGRSHAVQVTTTKIFKTAKAASNYRKRAK